MADDQTNNEIVRATPAARRRAIVLTAGMMLVGLAALAYCRWRIESAQELAKTDRPAAVAKLSSLLQEMLVGVGVSLIAIAGFMGRLGWKILQAEQFPPAGAAVVRDVRVVRGLRARRMGMTAIAFAVILLATGAVGVYRFHEVIANWMESAARPVEEDA